ncbi:hypothetical protein ACFQMG_27700 [Kitasatospora paranensis]|uniref:Uncharacterized protein n=1 Tax=Kitasatospora paranensis TaxID=258053 RepID=A0ABW2G1F0_9ACTN
METETDLPRPVAEELRDRAGAFVNSHVDLWVAVEGEETLVLAGDDARALFQAAADWLGEGSRHEVADLRWTRQPATPTQALRLRLVPPGTAAAVIPAPGGAAG